MTTPASRSARPRRLRRAWAAATRRTAGAPAPSWWSRYGRCPASTAARPVTPPDDYQGNSANWKQWQSASNWRNRFVFPVTLPAVPRRLRPGLDGSRCRPRAPSCSTRRCSPGAEVLHVEDLFKLGFTRVNDDAARRNLDFKVAGQYSSNLSFTSEPAPSIRGRPVVNAPVAVTGFTVAVTLDNKNFEQLDDVQPERAPARQTGHGVVRRPAGPDLNVREPTGSAAGPGVRQAQPGLVEEPAAGDLQIDNPILVQGTPDLVYEVTRYIASDPKAVAWLSGKPDPWGMKVNPTYQGDRGRCPARSRSATRIWKDDPSKCEPKPLMEQAAQFVYDLLASPNRWSTGSPSTASASCRPAANLRVVSPRPSAARSNGRCSRSWTSRPRMRTSSRPPPEERRGQFVEPSPSRSTRRWTSRGTTPRPKRSRKLRARRGRLSRDDAGERRGADAWAGDEAGGPVRPMIRWMSTSGQTYGDAPGSFPRATWR